MSLGYKDKNPYFPYEMYNEISYVVMGYQSIKL